MIRFERRDNVEIASFTTNKINAFITDEIRDQLIRVFENSSSKLIIDLKGVEYIDSSGFGCFLSVLKAAKSNYGIVKFVNTEPAVQALFVTLHLHTIFEIYRDTEECIRSFR